MKGEEQKLPRWNWAKKLLDKAARALSRQEKRDAKAKLSEQSAADRFKGMFQDAVLTKRVDQQRAPRGLKATASLSKRRQTRARKLRKVSCLKTESMR